MTKHNFDKLTDSLIFPIIKDRDIEEIRQEYLEKNEDPEQIVTDGLSFIAKLKNNYPEVSTPLIDISSDFVMRLAKKDLLRLSD